MRKVDNIGFMQGRLSVIVDNKIQAFPWIHWQQEFPIAEKHGFHFLEWTLDQERLYSNPLLTSSGQMKILKLCKKHHVSIPSLTGDCFMQAPFWKADGDKINDLKKDFLAIARACSKVGIKMIVVPLVDNGSLDTKEQEDLLISFLQDNLSFFEDNNLQIIFESDFTPSEFAMFIDRLPLELFGVNYDVGNSAALGYSPTEEFAAYGHRIMNVHIKDRMLFGTTVPLGEGSADFEQVFSLLAQIGYSGNLILQTARAIDNDHAKSLCKFRDMVMQLMLKFNIKLERDLNGT